MLHIFIKCRPTQSYIFRGETFGIDSFYVTIFIKGERIKGYLATPAGKVGSEVIAQQFGITSCQHDMQPCTNQTVDKQWPTFHILYFVKEYIVEVTIYLVKNFKNIIQLNALQSYQTLIIKIDIGESLSDMLQRLKAQGGFSTASHSYYYLRLRTIHIDESLFPARAKSLISPSLHLFFLVSKYDLQVPFAYNFLFHKCKDNTKQRQNALFYKF